MLNRRTLLTTAGATETVSGEQQMAAVAARGRRPFGTPAVDARAEVLGETIRLSGHPYTVVGIAPARFTRAIPGIPTAFWVPVTMVER